MAHSILAPSQASRWLKCTPSAMLEASMPRSESTYASEGTLAHSMAAALLQVALAIISPDRFKAIETECRSNEQWADEMFSYCQDYARYCVETCLNPDTLTTLVEQSNLELEPYVPKAFGTADFIAFDGITLHVVDFKYGKGVDVEVVDNPQLKLYGLGAINRLGINVTDNHLVKLHIVQPRIKPAECWEIKATELVDWGLSYVKPRAEMAIKGEGEYRPSADTCRFCRAKPVCKGLVNDVFASMKDMPDVNTLTLDQAAENLSKASMIKSWLTSLEEFVRDALLANKQVKGWKLVEGRSNRKIVNPLKATELLRRAGYPDELTHKLTLYGITDLEKLVGKKKLPDILGDTLIKPQGSPTMVEESDPRPAMAVDAAVLAEFNKVNF